VIFKGLVNRQQDDGAGRVGPVGIIGGNVIARQDAVSLLVGVRDEEDAVLAVVGMEGQAEQALLGVDSAVDAIGQQTADVQKWLREHLAIFDDQNRANLLDDEQPVGAVAGVEETQRNVEVIGDFDPFVGDIAPDDGGLRRSRRAVYDGLVVHFADVGDELEQIVIRQVGVAAARGHFVAGHVVRIGRGPPVLQELEQLVISVVADEDVLGKVPADAVTGHARCADVVARKAVALVDRAPFHDGFQGIAQVLNVNLGFERRQVYRTQVVGVNVSLDLAPAGHLDEGDQVVDLGRGQDAVFVGGEGHHRRAGASAGDGLEQLAVRLSAHGGGVEGKGLVQSLAGCSVTLHAVDGVEFPGTCHRLGLLRCKLVRLPVRLAQHVQPQQQNEQDQSHKTNFEHGR